MSLEAATHLPHPLPPAQSPTPTNTQDNYIQSRSTAIESIESTIAELGQIFSQLANMVAEQRETVQRIDADVSDISANVSGAQRELLKYYASISSNRWLMLKVFGVLIIFVSTEGKRGVECEKWGVVASARPAPYLARGASSLRCTACRKQEVADASPISPIALNRADCSSWFSFSSPNI